MTYLKYQQRDKDHYVNWAAISKEMTDFLNEEVADRETQRANLDKDSREFQEKLSKVEQGEHAGINEFTLDYANNATQQSLMQDRLLKNGQLSLKDYNIARANLKQGTTELFSLSEKYQKVYKEMMGNPNLSQQSMYELSLVEGFTNFTKNRAFINPLTGNVSIGELTYEDGVGTLSGDSSDYTSVGSLNFALSSQILKWNDKQFVDTLNEWSKEWLRTYADGSTLNDMRGNPAFNDALKNEINAQLADPTAIASILADYRGGNYDFTTDPKKQDEYTILLIDDPDQPSSGRRVASFDSEIGKKQREDAYNYLNDRAQVMFGSTQTKSTQSVNNYYDGKAKEKNQQDLVQYFSSLYNGSGGDIESSISNIEESPGILEVQRNDKGIRILRESKYQGQPNEEMFVSFTADDGSILTEEQFVKAIYRKFTGDKFNLPNTTFDGTNPLVYNTEFTGTKVRQSEPITDEVIEERMVNLTDYSVNKSSKKTAYTPLNKGDEVKNKILTELRDAFPEVEFVEKKGTGEIRVKNSPKENGEWQWVDLYNPAGTSIFSKDKYIYFNSPQHIIEALSAQIKAASETAQTSYPTKKTKTTEATEVKKEFNNEISSY